MLGAAMVLELWGGCREEGKLDVRLSKTVGGPISGGEIGLNPQRRWRTRNVLQDGLREVALLSGPFEVLLTAGRRC